MLGSKLSCGTKSYASKLIFVSVSLRNNKLYCISRDFFAPHFSSNAQGSFSIQLSTTEWGISGFSLNMLNDP